MPTKLRSVTVWFYWKSAAMKSWDRPAAPSVRVILRNYAAEFAILAGML